MTSTPTLESILASLKTAVAQLSALTASPITFGKAALVSIEGTGPYTLTLQQGEGALYKITVAVKPADCIVGQSYEGSYVVGLADTLASWIRVE